MRLSFGRKIPPARTRQAPLGLKRLPDPSPTTTWSAIQPPALRLLLESLDELLDLELNVESRDFSAAMLAQLERLYRIRNQVVGALSGEREVTS